MGPAYGWVAECLVSLLDVGYDMFVQRFEHGAGLTTDSMEEVLQSETVA